MRIPGGPPVSPVLRPPRGLSGLRARGARWRASRQARKDRRAPGSRTSRAAGWVTPLMSFASAGCGVTAAAVTWGRGAAFAAAAVAILLLEASMDDDDQP